MTNVILHHYATSPYSEKVRLALGYKGMAWRSVTIPLVMPKPDLIALTGGYRKTPVMQIGADIYCDTACILRELERRHPVPSLYPVRGLTDALANWAETKMFSNAVGAVFAYEGEQIPQAFREDRTKFLGRDFNLQRIRAALPYMLDQLRACLDHLDGMLADSRAFLLAATPSAADLAAYHPLWFIVLRLGRPIAPLADYPRVLAWMERVKAIGHGSFTDLRSDEAVQIARGSTPAVAQHTDAADPAGRKPGDRISVCPDDTGRDPVVGELVACDAQEVIIRREDDRAGTLHVHFPRLGFSVMTAP